jgi:hypothetical protein
MIVQQGFSGEEQRFKSMLNKLEIQILKEISILQKENSEQDTLIKDLYQVIEKNRRIGQISKTLVLILLLPNLRE